MKKLEEQTGRRSEWRPSIYSPGMTDERPPTMDPVAARRWQASAHQSAPWLHEEIGRRMAQRLEWIRLNPVSWADWHPLGGGLGAHGLVQKHYPRAACHLVPASPSDLPVLARLSDPWWTLAHWRRPQPVVGLPADGSTQMVWSNMALHMAHEPAALIASWHRALQANGFLMFSALGPDTLRELRELYQALGWPPPSHAFTDMHDWGDMLVHAGFAEPVMDMERITLTFASAPRLLQELRELGRNLHPARFAGLRGRRWKRDLEQAMQERLATPENGGQLALTFEIVYGHAFKPTPRVPVAGESAVSLQDMRAMLRGNLRR